MTRIGNFLVKADNICDYIPVVSTATNLVDLFQKAVVIPKLDADVISSSHYYTHLKNKGIFRCLALLLPFIGNLLVAISDFREQPGMKTFLKSVKQEIEYSRKRLEPYKIYAIRF